MGPDSPQPAKKKRVQTRRSISLSHVVYNRLKDYCLANKKSMSGVVEEIVLKFFESSLAPLGQFKVGDMVDYHSIINGPVTLPDTIIEGGPYQDQGTGRLTYRVKGIRGVIAADALTKSKNTSPIKVAK
jgi:hypothetical protein